MSVPRRNGFAGLGDLVGHERGEHSKEIALGGKGRLHDVTCNNYTTSESVERMRPVDQLPDGLRMKVPR